MAAGTRQHTPGDATTATTCPYCGVGCGVLATVDAQDNVSVAGDPDHPANFGRLCSKGSALHETLALDDRLLHPFVNGEHSDWSTALDLVARHFREAIAQHGPDSVAFYVSGQLLTEDYYVANKLMKGFIGSANIDTNSRLCMASSVAGHKRAFGTDTVPGSYEDLEDADLVVLVGSNLAWCHPILYQRLAAAKEKREGMKVVVIDPRRTATCDLADLHLPIAPGTDVALFNGLLAHLDTNGRNNREYLQAHTTGKDDALSEAAGFDLAKVSQITGLLADDIAAFYKLFAANERTVTVYSQGVNQSTSGTDKVNAIINCHLLTGRIGKPGMGPFSVTGQPNAMGGREVGGLANQLASHLELENKSHRQALKAFWNAPGMADKPGLKAVDLFEAVAQRRIRALWIMATNPVDSLPDANAVRTAIKACPFVTVSDVTRHTDTTDLAHVLLPATAWGEKDGTVTNSERRISRQRSFLASPGQTRPDWWIICEVAKRMGFAEAFDYSGPDKIFDEYARSTTLEKGKCRDLDLSGLAGRGKASYDTLKPTMWPCSNAESSTPTKRFFANGGFYTPDRKARFIATPYRAPQTAPSHEFPLILNTGRIRDQWHTMTRTAKSPRLMAHIGEPFVEVHPYEAARRGVKPATLVKVRSKHGEIIARAVISERQQRGAVFAPMHWTDKFAANARIDAVVSPETDPVSGQPESKFTPVAVTPWEARWYGFAVLAEQPEAIAAKYWALARANEGWCVELAHDQDEADWHHLAERLFGITGIEGGTNANNNQPILAYTDRTHGQHRFVTFHDERLAGALYIAREPVGVARNWAACLLEEKFETPEARLKLLAAQPGKDQPDRGAIICSCYSVGANQIADAIARQSCKSLDDVGLHLGAGTNCGSCRPEIKSILESARTGEATPKF